MSGRCTLNYALELEQQFSKFQDSLKWPFNLVKFIKQLMVQLTQDSEYILLELFLLAGRSLPFLENGTAINFGDAHWAPANGTAAFA
jgi:hypothetical protein